MLDLKNLQFKTNELIAKQNKRFILKKLEQYYLAIDYQSKIKAKERAIFAFWQAKKQGRLDNLNRIVKINRGRT